MSVKLREMLDKRNVAITQARALIDKADTEKRELSAEEKGQYDILMKDAVTLRDNIDREQTLIDEEKRMAEESLRLADKKDKPQTPEAEARKKAFRHLLTLDISSGDRLSSDEVRALTAGTDTAAGYLTTPQEFVKSLIVAVKNNVFIRGLATGLTTTNANGLGVPALTTDVDDAEWSTEVKDASEDTSIAFGKRELKPHPLKKLIKISDKLLRADGIDPEAIVMDRAAYKFGVTNEKAFLLGTGAQQPLGLFVASAQGINTDRDYTCSAAVAADGFGADDIIGAMYNEKAQYMSSGAWLFHRDAVAKLAKLKDGDGRYIFEMSPTPDGKDQLRRRPLYMSEYVPNTFSASKYVGMFGDFKWYWIVDSLALRIKRLNELYAVSGQVGFIFDQETDGMPVLSEAFTRIKTAAA
jgi:HK97 family phage major capsid protein